MSQRLPPTTPAIPKYPRAPHKSGQARVKWRGRTYYLGRHGTPESRERYRAFLDRVVLPDAGGAPQSPPCDLLVAQLGVEWLRHCRGYYAKEEFTHHRIAFLLCAEMFGAERCIDFGPRKLAAVRDAMVARGWNRPHVNAAVHKLRRAFRWAASREMLPESVYERLRTLEPLRLGHTEAPESRPVEGVALGAVVAAACHMPRVLRDMVRLQWLTGMRPGEVCGLTPGEVQTGDGAWHYRPQRHKSRHLGRARVVVLGPKARAVLRPYLARGPSEPCFSPAEAQRQRGQVGRSRRVCPGYKPRSYRRAVEYACARAGVRWNPNQLRHSRGVLVRERFGLDVAQVILGHTHAKTTEIYAKAAVESAERAAEAIG